MEHRWGQRMAIKLPVRCNDGELVSWMRDVSASGAFIETVPLVPIFSLLHVAFMVEGSMQSIPAYVVRVCRDGLGVEWCTFAPQTIRALLMSATVARPRSENA